jgi:hypothetical protein
MRHSLVMLALLVSASAAFAQHEAMPPAQAASEPPAKHAAAMLDTTPPASCANPEFLRCASMTQEQCSGAYRDAAAEVNALTLKEIGDKTPTDQDLRFYRVFATGRFTPYFLSRAKLSVDTFMRCNQQQK